MRRKKWRALSVSINDTVEALWIPVLSQLRSTFSVRRPGPGNNVHTVDGVSLPGYVKQTLGLGPEFAVEPKRAAPDLLTMVRAVSAVAPVSEHDRCVSSGVNVLLRSRPPKSGLPLRRIESFIKENDLRIPPADKKGGFMVVPNAVFHAKASEALSSTFDFRTDIALDKVKARAKKLCAKLNVDALAKKVEKSSGCAPKMFFSAKTHKVACPLRVIISERGTWQN
ncbi:hypothetical protein HPB48_015368 [Haemaphysalis longicornis]|uniref:Uncharacterized protein n=1 Tax=Haemaphysalis longicornis TaxID=44386 RepID=A0A9J6GJZ4_HAELO|nr:hypothetical protein HPB48_015368 [Haemaphysalis longicornis]